MRLPPSVFRCFWALCWVCVAGCVLISLAAFGGGWRWYLDLFSHFRPTYFGGLMLSATIAAAGRRWFLLAVSACGLLVNGIALAPHARPSLLRDHAQVGAPVLHLVTINLLWDNQERGTVLRLLRERAPDVVLLQEVSGQWLEALTGISDLYPHQEFDEHAKDSFGLGVLSRRGWANVEVVRLGKKPDGLGLAMQLATSGRTIAILNIHGYHPTRRDKLGDLEQYQDSAVRWAADQARSGMPVVVAGDFNCTPWSMHFRRFVDRSGLFDTSQGRIFEATRHVWFPDRILIDHVLVSGDWRLLRREVGPDVGSDHRPVFVDLALNL